MSKRVLITGISGFVGSHMADYALELGCQVYGLKRWHLSRKDNIRHIVDRVTLLDCDITDPISVRSVIAEVGPEIIFHYASESFVSPSWKHPSHYMDVNYKGTVNILDAMRMEGVRARLHIPGSGEEYGKIYEDELPISPGTILRPVNPYAVSKVAQDLIGYVYFESYGLNVIRTRTFNHEGPRRDNVFGIPWYAYQIARIEAGLQSPIVKVGHIDDRRNFTHIRDIVEAYWLAVKKCEPGSLYLIGSDEPEHVCTFREVLERLIEMSSYRGITYEQDERFVRPTNVPRLIADTERFRELTGWHPKITIAELLNDILEYWRNQIRKDIT